MGFEFELICNVAKSVVNTATSSSCCCCCCKQMILIITILFLAMIRFAVKRFWVNNCLPLLTCGHNVNPKSGNTQETQYCTVCLDEVSNGDKYRQLPECKHCFHVECIDAWFQSRSTCPLCRKEVSVVVHHLHRDQHGVLISYLLGILQNIVRIMDKVLLNAENSSAFVMAETETSRYIF